MSPEEAFKQSSESITGPITKGISKGGILKLYEGLDKAGQDEFKARINIIAGQGANEEGDRACLFFLVFISVFGFGQGVASPVESFATQDHRGWGGVGV